MAKPHLGTKPVCLWGYKYSTEKILNINEGVSTSGHMLNLLVMFKSEDSIHRLQLACFH